MRSLPFDERKGCPTNYHKRASYTSKLGYRVPPRCVRSTTVYRESRRNYTQRVLGRQQARLRTAGKTAATRKLMCPKGKIERHGYVRKFAPSILRNGYTVHRASGKDYRVYPKRSSVFVKPGCVLDRGLPGPGQAGPGSGNGSIGPLRKGELKKYGYVFLKPEHERHEALNKAIKEYGALGVYRKLDAIAKLSMRTAPEASKVFTSDRRWLREHYKLKAF